MNDTCPVCGWMEDYNSCFCGRCTAKQLIPFNSPDAVKQRERSDEIRRLRNELHALKTKG